jgi:serine/threonine protein kinase
MANPNPGGQRSNNRGDDPASWVARFRRSRAANPQVDLAGFLPPSGSPDRTPILIELIKIDLELRAKAGQPTRLEPYLQRFADDLPATIPMGLLYQEYRVRHQFADAPAIGEYQARFPDCYESFRRYVDEHPVEKPLAGTVLPSVNGPQLYGETPADDTQPLQPPAKIQPTLVPPPPPPAPPPPPPPQHSMAELAADLEYKKIKRLGKGAYGTVYLGQAPGGVPVAIKQIHRGVDHPIGKSELDALEAIKRLSHPFLIQTHTFWVERDQINIVMELAEGSLADWIDECKDRGQFGPPVEELIPFFAQAAAALDYLHTQKVSHRDVKPQNLLRLRGYAKVADFGLARVHSHQMTHVAHECGTPLFMAPEVWSKRVSFRSDQYSLAATYVYARLGRPLFDVDDLGQLVLSHLQATPNLEPLPPAEQTVLLKALAKNPEDRYPSCQAFVEALRQAVSPPPTLPPPRRWPRMAGAAMAVSAITALLAALLWPTESTWPPSPSVENVWIPPGWSAVAGTAIDADWAGQRFYREIERPVGEVKLTAILVPQARADDPATFYLLRDKVTNRVMKQVWDAVESPTRSTVMRFATGKAVEWRRTGHEPLPGTWREGASPVPPPDAPLGIDGEQHDVPVVKVTTIEAALTAIDLGGRLPNLAEWERAIRDLPTDHPFDAKKWALGLTRPLRIDAALGDVTHQGIRQLLTNGKEWTRTMWRKGLPPFSPDTIPPVLAEHHLVMVVGQIWEAEPFGTVPIKKQPLEWYDTTQQISFRIAIPTPASPSEVQGNGFVPGSSNQAP